MPDNKLDLLLNQLHQAGTPPRFDPDTSRLLVTMWRRVAENRPVTSDELEQIAERLDLTRDFVNETLKAISEFDDDGNLVGTVGLSQRDFYVHKLRVNGQQLSTWCAWDALFLPLMLGQTAYIESPSPTTEERVRISLSPAGIEKVTPGGAVISFVVPNPASTGIQAVEEIWMMMCNHIHFFTSHDDAQKWLDGKALNSSVLTVEEGFELGRRAFGDLLKYV